MRFDLPSWAIASGIAVLAIVAALLLHAAARFVLQRVVRGERAPALKAALEATARHCRGAPNGGLTEARAPVINREEMMIII